MEKFDVGCLLSRWEGFGLAIPEYMLTKTPIVATRVDAIPYLITDGVDGLLVDKDSWKDAADKVISIFLNKINKTELIENANITVHKRFNVKRVSKETEELFESV